MRRIAFGLVLGLVLLSGMNAVAAQAGKSTDIRDLMSVIQFHQAGLDRLTPQQLDALNAWLNVYLQQGHQASTVNTHLTVPVAASHVPAATFGQEQIQAQGPQQIESRIDGVLHGWTGSTVFKLENGQIWQQSGPGYQTGMRLDHPSVVIKKLAFGYLLTLPGNSETVFVRRIK